MSEDKECCGGVCGGRGQAQSRRPVRKSDTATIRSQGRLYRLVTDNPQELAEALRRTADTIESI